MRKKSSKEIGSGSTGIAACMVGFSLIYFVFYFILNYVYDTKESRKILRHPDKNTEKIVVSKEDVMRRGIGKHVFKCYGFLNNSCRPMELYMDTVETNN